MKKVGKKVIFDNINMEIDFTLDDILDHFNVDSFKFANGNLLNADKLISEEPNLIFDNYSLKEIMKYGDIFKDDYKSIRNLIHQLFSLKKVYEISKAYNSDLTIFARPDLYYWDSFEKNIHNLLNNSKDYIAIPNWQF